MSLLQGTFGVYEKLSNVYEFVREHVVTVSEFVLTTGTGQRLTELDRSLVELHLVPTSLLLFIALSEAPQTDSLLLPEVLIQLQTL